MQAWLQTTKLSRQSIASGAKADGSVEVPNAPAAV